MEWKKTQCNLCAESCGLEMLVRDNEIVDVRPDPDTKRTEGAYCCRKGRSSKYFANHDQRLDYPLKKVGDHFERISWEQAISEIAEKTNAILGEHGPRTFAYVGGALAGAQGDGAFAGFMLDAIGSQYMYNPIGIEFAGHWWSHGKILGDQSVFFEPDDRNVDVLMFWGSNSYVTHNFGTARFVIREFSENPDKLLIDVDPRLSETARMADLHIRNRPGSDSLLLRGLIALILDKGWQDQKFLDRWVGDWDRAKRWYEGFDYRKAFEVARVPLAQMEEFAKILTTRTWGVHPDLGMFCGRNNTTNSFLLLSLMAVTGNMQVKGNVLLDGFAAVGKSVDENDPKVWRTLETKRLPVLGAYPAGVLADEILSKNPQHLRCLFVSYGNPARSFPDSKRMSQALDSLDLLVDIDIVMSETARHADYVLPGKTGYETPEFTVFQGTPPDIECQLRQPIIGQIAERREDTSIWFDILDAMGYIPDIPDSLYKAAEKAVATNDRMPFLFKLAGFVALHPKYMDKLPLLLCKAMRGPMGSVNKTLMWAALVTSPMAGSGMAERAGWGPTDKHPLLNKLPAYRKLSVMDNVFQAVADTPQGVVAGTYDPDGARSLKKHIKHKDGKLHLWCTEVDGYMPRLTPEAEEKALTQEGEYPYILSAGRHSDDGHNGCMRNPATYVYRKPYTVLMNPLDAQALGIGEGEEVRVVTQAGELTAPAEISFQAAQGYMLIPHHFGLTFGDVTVGTGVNTLTSHTAIDDLTGNPLIRYVPCRVEKLKGAVV